MRLLVFKLSARWKRWRYERSRRTWNKAIGR